MVRDGLCPFRQREIREERNEKRLEGEQERGLGNIDANRHASGDVKIQHEKGLSA